MNRQITNCTVSVVPMSAPRIMARELEKLISPALTSPMVSAVDADELWKTIVEKIPVIRPYKGFPTAYLMYALMRTSMSFRTAEERLNMPIRNKMMPLMMINICFVANTYP